MGGGGHQPFVGGTAVSFASAHTTQAQTIPDSIFFCFFSFFKEDFFSPSYHLCIMKVSVASGQKNRDLKWQSLLK